jgi:hypothetical protein
MLERHGWLRGEARGGEGGEGGEVYHPIEVTSPGTPEWLRVIVSRGSET